MQNRIANALIRDSYSLKKLSQAGLNSSFFIGKITSFTIIVTSLIKNGFFVANAISTLFNRSFILSSFREKIARNKKICAALMTARAMKFNSTSDTEERSNRVYRRTTLGHPRHPLIHHAETASTVQRHRSIK